MSLQLKRLAERIVRAREAVRQQEPQPAPIIGFSLPEAEKLLLEANNDSINFAQLKRRIDSPEIEDFLRAVHLEAIHQVERWGAAHDRAKRSADWFWLVGYLAGKALHAAVAGDRNKALHHCISTAAALYNWHCAIKGTDVSMCPGRSDLAELVEREFPGDATNDQG